MSNAGKVSIHPHLPILFEVNPTFLLWAAVLIGSLDVLYGGGTPLQGDWSSDLVFLDPCGSRDRMSTWND